jgi:anhydro-N-acetylmuramic acid kinase
MHGVQPDWVEAMAFAWLAQCHLDNRPGNLPSVTGASEAVVLGILNTPDI